MTNSSAVSREDETDSAWSDQKLEFKGSLP